MALYARVSTKDKGQDTENQLRELRSYAERQGWTITEEYIDHESAKSGDRVRFQALLLDVTRAKFDVVLVWALDRLTREGIEATFGYVRRLKENAVDFVSYTEAHFRTTGPAGELMLAIAAWIAEQERKRMGERVRAGMKRVKETGMTRSGKAVGRPVRVLPRQAIWQRRQDGATYRELRTEFEVGQGVIQRTLKAMKMQSACAPEGAERKG